MSLLEILILAVGLSMDALAVSVTAGFGLKDHKWRPALKMAFAFGIFQALMPLAGWAAGLSFRQFITSVDHWIAFGLLETVGIKMILEAFKKDDAKSSLHFFQLPILLLLAIATSIDALAVGIGFAFLNVSIVKPVLIIGAVTFVLCFFGVLAGKKCGHLLENKMKLVGGLILIGIGIKILADHLVGM